MANQDYPSARPFLPDERDHEALAEAAKNCEGCPLFEEADHVVFGEGPIDARLMLVGESPGRTENERGRPFVGAAGRLLDEALEESGLSREEVYVTNAVKHIRRESTNGSMESTAPRVAHIEACRPWLDAEIQLVTPQRLVALGTHAARSILGRQVTIAASRGQFHDSLWGIEAVITYHPAAGLHAGPGTRRDELFDNFVDDLRLAQRPPETPPRGPRPRA